MTAMWSIIWNCLAVEGALVDIVGIVIGVFVLIVGSMREMP